MQNALQTLEHLFTFLGTPLLSSIALALFLLAALYLVFSKTKKRVAFVEADIFCHKPLAFHGRVDCVEYTSDNRLLVVDIKRRAVARYYASDQIQLSVYAYILRNSSQWHVRWRARKGVCNYAILRCVHPSTGAIENLKVPLLSEQALEKLSERYWSLIDNPRLAQKNPISKNFCAHCSFYKKQCSGV